MSDRHTRAHTPLQGLLAERQTLPLSPDHRSAAPFGSCGRTERQADWWAWDASKGAPGCAATGSPGFGGATAEAAPREEGEEAGGAGEGEGAGEEDCSAEFKPVVQLEEVEVQVPPRSAAAERSDLP